MAEEKGGKTARVRSPAYPAFHLEAAIGYAEAIYDKERRHSAPVAVAARHCGTELTSSVGLRLISGLKQFGLVVEEGRGEDRQIRLSDRALDILLAESPDSPNRMEAVRQAALHPKIHKDLWQHYAGNLPSDESMRAYLIRKLEFNDKKVGRFIKEFRATLAFAELTQSDIVDKEEDNGAEEQDDTQISVTPEAGSPKALAGKNILQPPAESPYISFPLSGGNAIEIRLRSKVSRKDFETVKRLIELSAAALVEEPASANAHNAEEG